MTFQRRPLYGYRVWRVRRDGALRSLGLFGVWPTDKPMSAVCWKRFLRPGHGAPGEGCTCGVYALRTPMLETESAAGSDFLGPHVRGVVEMWGKVIVHEDGYRAEYARPVAVEASPLSAAVASRYGLIVLGSLGEWEGQ